VVGHSGLLEDKSRKYLVLRIHGFTTPKFEVLIETFFMTERQTQSQPISNTPATDLISEKKAMTRAAGVVAVWTTLSRVLGFVRDMVIALFLGAGLGADAFFVAFRIPNLLRRLFAEGALSAAFIPTYVETIQKGGTAEGERVARIAFTLASIVLAVVTVAGIVLSPWLVRIIAPGFFQVLDKFQLTVELNRIMFPYIFFISLVALASGVLNSLGYFAAPAAAPVLLNLSMIVSVAFCAGFLKIEAYYGLAWGVVIAGVLQLALQIPVMRAAHIRIAPDFHFRHPALKRMGVLFVPAAFGGAVYQINVLVGTILASMLPEGGVSWLYYADRIVELPLGMFAVALGTAVLPSMSRLANNGDMKALISSVSFSLRLIAFFTIPASVALIVLAEPIVGVLFQRGRFTLLDTQQTADALVWYTVGLWAFSGLKVVTQSFFALKDTRTPLWVSIGAVVVNLVAGLLLMKPMAQGGLALATSLAAAFNLLVLFVLLLRRVKGFPVKEFLISLGKLSAASLIMGAALLYGRVWGEWHLGLTALNLVAISCCIVGGLLIFVAAAHVLRCPELRSLLYFWKHRGT
jgi:putative peptidoglycan lipid II flippase